jgi:hypothetical protein
MTGWLILLGVVIALTALLTVGARRERRRRIDRGARSPRSDFDPTSYGQQQDFRRHEGPTLGSPT